MLRRMVFIAGVGVIALLVAGGIVYASTRSTTTSHSWAKAKAARATVACLKVNPRLNNIPAAMRNSIEVATLAYLSDVPAGTDARVKLASYSPTTVTGSDYYPAKYGNYNFVLTQQNDGWHVTDFERSY